MLLDPLSHLAAAPRVLVAGPIVAVALERLAAEIAVAPGRTEIFLFI
jgi:hypothetical protein